MRNLLVISRIPETEDAPDHMCSLTCRFLTQWLEDGLQQQQLNATDLPALQGRVLNCSKTNLALGSLVGNQGTGGSWVPCWVRTTMCP